MRRAALALGVEWAKVRHGSTRENQECASAVDEFARSWQSPALLQALSLEWGKPLQRAMPNQTPEVIQINRIL
jgi:hypothetical protein